MKLTYLIASLLLLLGTCDIPRTDCQYLDEDSVGGVKPDEDIFLREDYAGLQDDETNNSTDEATVTTEEATVPTEETTVPTGETTAPAEEATTPTEEGTVPTEESNATEVTEDDGATSEAPSSPDSSGEPSPGIPTFPPTPPPPSTEVPTVLPPLDPKDSPSLSTFGVIAISILVSFAAIFTGLFFLRKYCIKKRKEDQRRLLRGSVSSEGFFYGGDTAGYSDRIHDRI